MSASDEVIERAEARVGTTLKGKWRIDALLGAGGMAVVYAATHRNNKRVAIKMLHPELSVHSDIRARFLREGYVANTVDHPGAVSVLDDDETEDGTAFIVMELIEGETTIQRADRKGGCLSAIEVLSIADQLLDVLIAAHAKGVIHRDIKPDNLFLDRNNQLKVLDFGIARLRESADQSSTRTGSLMGTPSFMPPEQARGLWNKVDQRSDLWAVGATMFTLLSGYAVHQAETANDALAMAITERAPSLATVMPDAPPTLVAVVDRALAYEQENRFPDAASMQQAVRQAYGALNSDAQAPPGVAQRPPLLSQPYHSYPTANTALAGMQPSQPGVAVTSPPFPQQLPPHTTTHGAASSSLDIPQPPKNRTPILLLAGGVAAVVLLAVAAFVLHSRAITPASASAPSAVPSAAASPPASQARATPVVSAVPSPGAAASASAGQVPSAAPPAVASVAKPPPPAPENANHGHHHWHPQNPTPHPSSNPDSLGGQY